MSSVHQSDSAEPGEPAGLAPVFGQLTGQEIVVDQLQRAVNASAGGGPPGLGRSAADRGAAGRRNGAPGGGAGMTHAWLFTGPPGSGRSLAARAFAAALLCERGGCGECQSCHQVAAGTHADVLLIRPDGLSYGVRQTRELVLKAAAAPIYGRWRIVLFEDADRCTEQAANALLKAIEEPSQRTVWLLCAPYADDLPTTIRSRCRLVTLVTPRTAAVTEVLQREGVPADRARAAALAAQGHIGRARRLATDEEAARRRAEVLRAPGRVSGLGEALKAAAALVKAAKAEADATTDELDAPEREALRRAFGEGSSGKGVAAALRGGAGALRELEERQKSRATRLTRDSLDRALLDLAGYYRDVLAVQLGASVELANEARDVELRQLAGASGPADTVRRIEAIMRCRQRLEANAAPLLAVEELTLALSGRS
jgi:DNA polymerase III subunit delta'